MGMAESNRRPDRTPAIFREEWRIASNFDESKVVQKQIVDDVARRGFNHQCIFAIKLALEEALNNAIRHGNRLDKIKHVHIKAIINDKQSEIIIEDEGPGFDRAGVPDPTLDENLEKCSGRGILLIEAYMDRAEWTKGGRRLRMIKRNEPDVLPRPKKNTG
jgi:serine/threonine-protein kinase RsbW